jgi:hypothetical protein
MPTHVAHQGVQQIMLVPVFFVNSVWVNSQVGHDANGTIMYPNMVSQQQPQLYQVAGQCIQGSAMPGTPNIISSHSISGTLVCQHAQVAPLMQDALTMPAKRNDVAVPSHDEAETLCVPEILLAACSCEADEEAEDSADELSIRSISVTFDDKYDSRSFASSEASTAASRTARRRRGRKVAKARAKQEALSAIPLLESPPLDEILVNTAMKTKLTQQLEAGGQERQMALAKITGSVLKMSFEPFGCRVVQLAFDVAGAFDRQSMAAELRGHVREAISSPHANFVVQKVIEVLPVSSTNFVATELLTFAVDAARHRYACRILCRLIEHHLCDRAGSTTTNRLIDELLPDTDQLIRHNFARHVIELILEHGNRKQQESIIRAIRNDMVRHAKDRYASYVVEQVLSRCSIPDRDALASDLINDIEIFWALANHECGSHVIKALLKSQAHASTQAKNLLKIGAAKCTTKYGQRLLEDIK